MLCSGWHGWATLLDASPCPMPSLSMLHMHGSAVTAVCSFEDGLKLVKLRGESMQAAADAAPSAMVSVIGLDADKVTPPDVHLLLQAFAEPDVNGVCGTANVVRNKCTLRV